MRGVSSSGEVVVHEFQCRTSGEGSCRTVFSVRAFKKSGSIGYCDISDILACGLDIAVICLEYRSHFRNILAVLAGNEYLCRILSAQGSVFLICRFRVVEAYVSENVIEVSGCYGCAVRIRQPPLL